MISKNEVTEYKTTAGADVEVRRDLYGNITEINIDGVTLNAADSAFSTETLAQHIKDLQEILTEVEKKK